ncbi:class I SAM-dependent methyltransferase [Candidatus Parcubacteria bacterium]|nr:class I SAM-dependent methyltransferase [Candidatus Parcubacteria bacterium]
MIIRKLIRKYILPHVRFGTVHWINTIHLLRIQFKRLKPGVVLDFGSGSSPLKRYVPHTKYMRLDLNPDSQPDICCDLHNVQWESNYFDTVISTEVLEHVYDPQRAVSEIYRILKKGGVCILSTVFIYQYHPDSKDYYRFTWDSLNHLFKDFEHVEIFHHGNKFQAI